MKTPVPVPRYLIYWLFDSSHVTFYSLVSLTNRPAAAPRGPASASRVDRRLIAARGPSSPAGPFMEIVRAIALSSADLLLSLTIKRDRPPTTTRTAWVAASAVLYLTFSFLLLTFYDTYALHDASILPMSNRKFNYKKQLLLLGLCRKKLFNIKVFYSIFWLISLINDTSRWEKDNNVINVNFGTLSQKN